MSEETSNKLTYIKLNVDKAIPKDIHGRPLYQFNIGDSDDDDGRIISIQAGPTKKPKVPSDRFPCIISWPNFEVSKPISS